MVMGSAFDILSLCWPPRVSFVNYPLGHSCGKPLDVQGQFNLVKAALQGLESFDKPGQVNVLECDWGTSTDYCTAIGQGKGALKQKRDEVKKYQCQADMDAAVARHGASAHGVVSVEAVRQASVFRQILTSARSSVL